MSATTTPLETHTADVCVVGGGMAGLTAALAAARHGARTVLIHDRPVLGGNASSECRVHICGADRHNGLPYLRETGILEEIRLENLRRNPERNFSLWDLLLYEKAAFQPNLTLLLNCSVNEAVMDGPRIVSVTGWQLTTQTRHQVQARIFIDCSGDAILAPLTGAAVRVGRDARAEFNEPSAPAEASPHTMGMTCVFYARPHLTSQPFTPPAWAHTYETCEQLPYGAGGHRHFGMGYWWIELGGTDDSIRDTERIRDELLKTVLGVWDHIKNRCHHTRAEADLWGLEWLQFLPSKRESRRYVGQHVLSQADVLAGGRSDDLVAYGGWAMDDHRSSGFRGRDDQGEATIFYPTPSPFGIPYRSLVARDIPNLMFAGRCHSATHLAMSATRVMGTGCSMGQAAGTAAALAAARGLDPAGLLPAIGDLQQTLLRDDAYLPGIPAQFGDLTRTATLAASQGDPEPVRDGVNRPVDGNFHSWHHRAGDTLTLRLARPARVDTATLILDSALHLDAQMSHWYPLNPQKLVRLPPELPHTLVVTVEVDGAWHELARIEGNTQRLVRVPVGRTVSAVRYRLEQTWGPCNGTHLYALYVD